MATQLQLRRGTTTEHSTFVGAVGEVTVDTTKDTLVVHDGATTAGFPLAKESTVTALDSAAVHKTGDETVSGTKTFSSNPVLSTGTANGVAYLNGSKVLTTGSALTFNGNRLTSTTGKFGGGAATNSASLMVNNVTNTATGIQLFQDGVESWIMGMPANSAGLAWSASGTEQMRLTSTGLGIGTSSPSTKLHVAGATRVQDSSNSANYMTFGVGANAPYGNASISTTTAGLAIVAEGAGSMTFLNNGSERMRIDSSGNVGIGNSIATANQGVGLEVGNSSGGNISIGTNTAAGTNGSPLYTDISFRGYSNYETARIRSWDESSSTSNGSLTFWTGQIATPLVERMRIDSNGYIKCPGMYAATTGSAANMFVDSNGYVYRSTSSLKYKRDVVDAEHGLADVLKLRPVTYKGKAENDGEKVFGGLIAEEVDAAGLTEFVQYADDGSPDALAYGNMVSLCIKAIQELKAELDATKAEVAALKAIN